jgi:type I restriction-modification system DNA methylase subunit
LPEAPKRIQELVEKYKLNYTRYRDYNEEQIKQEFINPLFDALGWDIYNKNDIAPQYRDVIFEDSLRINKEVRAPDYCFQLPGKRMFFVEAKKPSINIKEKKESAFQVRSYAWSANLPLSILTDFEELAIYDTRVKPNKRDKAGIARLDYFTYDEYVDRWEDIYNIFSKEAVLKGSFDQYAEDNKKKRGTEEVDDSFLSDLEEWRELLAKNIALRNPETSIEELNYAVQHIIDRIVFLRMCEDRRIEKYGKLRSLKDENSIYEKFCELCVEADDKYNSGLFHFKVQKGRDTIPDQITLGLKIDDGVFKTIFTKLYYPESPYIFNFISPEILGHTYEQFLGKVIRLTDGHRAKVEEKPEVKKAGGVYYTPQYIVNYIVDNTIGKLVKGKTPNKVSEIKILDPACGSGSFLLGAFNYLLKWHLNYYTKRKDRDRLTDKIYQFRPKEYRLTIREKKKILINNIYGVDIDPQAVEVTKLSLLLKVLEDENKDELEEQKTLFKERALPDLDSNIKCGNSLIGSEIFDEEIEGVEKINFFDWNSGFSGIMEKGGFDAIIGNPPYIRVQAMKEWSPIEVEFYKKKYVSASKGNYDIYVVFVERGLELLNEKGVLGYILPHKFFNAKYGQPLRSLIADGKNINKIVHFGDQQIFENATTYTNLLFLTKSKNKNFEFMKVDDLNKWRNSGEAVEGKIALNKVSNDEWNFIVGHGASLFEKLSEIPIKLGDMVRIFQGLTTGADKVFILEHVESVDSDFIKAKNVDGSEHIMEREMLKPLIKGVSVFSYEKPIAGHWIVFPYNLNDHKSIPLKLNTIRSDYPKTYDYLMGYKNILSKKSNTNSTNWWLYSYPKNLLMHKNKKLLVQVISKNGRYAYDDIGIYFTGGGNGPYYGMLLKDTNNFHSLHYLQGILSSNVLDFYLKKISSPFRGGYWSYGKRFIDKLPIRVIDFENPEDVDIHNKIVELVKKMLKLNETLVITKVPNKTEMIQRQIDAIDNQLNLLVYKLYGLTDKEIEIVKGA